MFASVCVGVIVDKSEDCRPEGSRRWFVGSGAAPSGERNSNKNNEKMRLEFNNLARAQSWRKPTCGCQSIVCVSVRQRVSRYEYVGAALWWRPVRLIQSKLIAELRLECR